MVIVKELSAHLEVELPADLVSPLPNVLRLQFDVPFAIKTGFHPDPFCVVFHR